VKCSTKLWLCYDTQTGFVADPRNPQATTGWSLPPQLFDRDGDGIRSDDCGAGHYFWQLAGQGFGACYDPVSGYAFNELTNSWVFQGEDFKLGQVGGGGSSDSGCSLSNAAGSDEPAQLPLGLGVALGAVATLGYRRRARR
jgi:hypothetical protein